MSAQEWKAESQSLVLGPTQRINLLEARLNELERAINRIIGLVDQLTEIVDRISRRV